MFADFVEIQPSTYRIPVIINRAVVNSVSLAGSNGSSTSSSALTMLYISMGYNTFTYQFSGEAEALAAYNKIKNGNG